MTLSAANAQVCGGSEGGRKRNSGTPSDRGSSLQRPSQLFAANLGCCPLPPSWVQKNLKKMTQIWVISNCDYLRANYCLLHHRLACSCLPLALLLLTISLSLALPPATTTARTAEESVPTSVRSAVVYQLCVQVPDGRDESSRPWSLSLSSPVEITENRVGKCFMLRVSSCPQWCWKLVDLCQFSLGLSWVFWCLNCGQVTGEIVLIYRPARGWFENAGLI